jgi:cellulose synthase/poly-beta-1,6-N-acetylglucosamine synthase-like glycosyltransferase
MPVIIIILAISFAYMLVIMLFTFGWFRNPDFLPDSHQPHTTVSVVVALRNEEANCEDLFGFLAAQDYPVELTEIIFVDDHSQDNTYNILKSLISKFGRTNFKLIKREKESEQSFKKAAIENGIRISTGKLIITTDADCRAGEQWISSIVSFYERDHPKLISAPVVFTQDKNVFQSLQSIEFMSLIASGAGSVETGVPVMCNGANLAFEKEPYYKTGVDHPDNKIISGDDVFLMLKIKKKYGSRAVRFLKCRDAVVMTPACSTLKSFCQQRIRWVSKSKNYRDAGIICVSLIVFLYNLLLLTAMCASAFSYMGLKVYLALLVFKIIIDLPLLYGVSGFFYRKKELILAIPLQLIYPFYIVIFAVFGQFIRFEWKNRKF